MFYLDGCSVYAGIAQKHSSIHNNVLYESNDDDIAEDMPSLLDDSLSTTFNKHVA